jgi:hypothetical protein
MRLQQSLKPAALAGSLLLPALLAACSSGGEPPAVLGGICQAVPQSLVSSGANIGSTLANADQAVDDNFSSYATLTPSMTDGGGRIRSAAAVQQAAGSIAGTAFSLPASGSFTVTVTTYLGGVQQETGAAGPDVYGSSNGVQGNCGSPGICTNNSSIGTSFFGLHTTKPYDSIQVAFSIIGTTTPVQIKEICVD